MNCQEFEDRLQRRLDGERIHDADSDAHLLACSTCRSLQAAAAQLERGLRLLRQVDTPSGLSGRVVRQLAAERRQDVQRRRMAFVGALAASLFVAFLVKYAWLSMTPTPTPKVPEIVQKEAAPALQETAGEAQAALTALLTRTAEETVNQGRLLLPDHVPAPMMAVDDWQPSFEAPPLPLREAGQGVSAGLEPVASSARRAINLFLREIPPMPVEEKP